MRATKNKKRNKRINDVLNLLGGIYSNEVLRLFLLLLFKVGFISLALAPNYYVSFGFVKL